MTSTATDLGQRCDEAIVAILSADAALQELVGRLEELVVPSGDFGTTPLPVLLYSRVVLVQVGGLRDTREVTYDLTAVTEGEGGRALANALLERAEIALTQPALAAQGLDASPIGAWVRRSLGVRADFRAQEGIDAKERVAEQLEARFRVTKS